MFEKKERLKSVELLKDTLCGGKLRYFLALTYEFEDAQENVHEVYISRVPLPICNLGIPEIKHKSVVCAHGTYINVGESIDVGYGDVDLPGDYVLTDTIVKYGIKEMTIEEIEKELGYKVKIVSGEEKS